MSTQAMEPPPAPMVVISIIGVRTTMPKSMEVSGASIDCPPAISETSKEVPPMSPVITSGKPASVAMWPAAMTPAAGPERAVRMGSSQAVSIPMTPPFDCTIMNSDPNPPSRSAVSSRCR